MQLKEKVLREEEFLYLGSVIIKIKKGLFKEHRIK